VAEQLKKCKDLIGNCVNETSTILNLCRGRFHNTIADLSHDHKANLGEGQENEVATK
jgi:hypothetical protein